jgi:hypothetical protein
LDIELLTERHAAQIGGVLSCWDRVLVFGTLPKICNAGAMTSNLYGRKVRIFDYPGFAEPFRDQLRENAERQAAEAGIEIEFLRKRNFRNKDRVKEILAQCKHNKQGRHNLRQVGLSYVLDGDWLGSRPKDPCPCLLLHAGHLAVAVHTPAGRGGKRLNRVATILSKQSLPQQRLAQELCLDQLGSTQRG